MRTTLNTIAVLIALAFLTACGGSNSENADNNADGVGAERVRAMEDSLYAKPGMDRKVTAIEPHTLDMDIARSKFAAQRNHLGCGGLGVISIDQQNHVVRMATCKMLESSCFVLMCLNVGMSLGTKQRDSIHCPGQYGSSTGKSCQIARPRGEQRRLRPVCTAHAKINQQLVWRNQHGAGRLGGDQRFKMHQIHDARFDQLSLWQRSGNPQDRLIRKKQAFFGHGMNIAVKTELLEIGDKRRCETWSKPSQLFRRKSYVFEKIKRLF